MAYFLNSRITLLVDLLNFPVRGNSLKLLTCCSFIISFWDSLIQNWYIHPQTINNFLTQEITKQIPHGYANIRAGKVIHLLSWYEASTLVEDDQVNQTYFLLCLPTPAFCDKELRLKWYPSLLSCVALLCNTTPTGLQGLPRLFLFVCFGFIWLYLVLCRRHCERWHQKPLSAQVSSASWLESFYIWYHSLLFTNEGRARKTKDCLSQG